MGVNDCTEYEDDQFYLLALTLCHEKEAPIFEEHENLYFDPILLNSREEAVICPK